MARDFSLPKAIVYEDNHVLVVNKSPGIPVQKDKTGDPCLTDYCAEFIRTRDQKPGNVYMTPAHRIDRPASGIVVMAKTSKAASRLTTAFRTQDTRKNYLIWVEPVHKSPPQSPLPPQGTMQDYIAKRPHGTSFICGKKHPKARQAHLAYEIVRTGKKRSLVSVALGTGRHHQIRIQFASRGYCVVGDIRYGAKRPLNDKSIALHAHQLVVPHPVRTEPLELEAPVPDTWAEWGPKTGR